MSAQVAKEKHGFQTEVKQLLDLMVHALYSNKEIFLRELISNASDACDKLKFEALSKPELYEDQGSLEAYLTFDKEAKTITLRDNGIGMTRQEVMENLGTIAKSGTKEFLSSLSGDKAKDANLIGQFGVGFYSSFIVAKKVEVFTRKAGLSADQGVHWESEGDGDYTIESVSLPQRGTQVVLHLKSEEAEFLNDYRLRHIITKYSDHITLPVLMEKEEVETPEDPSTDEEGKQEAKKETKEKEANKAPEFEPVNRATALWTLAKNEIEDTQYNELYKHIAHDFEDPISYAHNKVEGKLEYTTLLYLPARAPYDLWQPNKSHGLKLYVQRVFIMDEAEQFVPHYLRFLKGIVDCNDLPLNISREILQSNRVVDTIRAAIVKRTLGMIETLSKDNDKYEKFWNEFGQVLKEGPAEDFANKEAIAKLLRFASTQSNLEKQSVSLKDYVSRMKEGQKKIYYLAADNFNAAKNSPHLEVFREKDIEVLLLYDRVDEWLMSHLTEFDGKAFQSVARGALDDLDFPKDDKADAACETRLKEKEETLKDLLSKVKEALGDKVKDVRLTERLTSSPSCIVADENEMTAQMERIMKAAGQAVSSKPVLELNPDHLLVQRLKDEQEAAQVSDWSQILLDQAILSEGGQLEDPASFVKKFNELLLKMAG